MIIYGTPQMCCSQGKVIQRSQWKAKCQMRAYNRDIPSEKPSQWPIPPLPSICQLIPFPFDFEDFLANYYGLGNVAKIGNGRNAENEDGDEWKTANVNLDGINLII
jgi:hypothetical protein